MNENKALARAEIEAAIAYFEDAVREIGEIISECSPDLQAELEEQKRHFAVALEALKGETSTLSNEALTLEELRGMSNTDWVWVVFPELDPVESCWYRAKKLYTIYSHKNYSKTWLAYRRKLDGGGE